MYVSKFVSQIWGKSVFPMGHTIGSVTFDSGAYIGRYITKRMSGVGVSPLPLAILDDGEIVYPKPEFLICSKGIGKAWFRDYFMGDVFPHGRVITAQGTPAPVPRYYKSLLKDLGADLAMDMSHRTYQVVADRIPHDMYENRPERKAARAVVARVNSSLFSRDPDKV